MLIDRFKKFLLVGGDILVLYLALYATLVLRFQSAPGDREWDLHLLPFSLLFALWLVIFYINGLYDIAVSKNDFTFYNKILTTILVSYGLAAAYFYFLTDKLFNIKPQIVFFIFLGVFMVFYSLWRYWYNSFIVRDRLARNVLVIGMNDEARELIAEIIRKPQLGYRIAAIVHGSYKGIEEFPDVAVYQDIPNFKKLIKEKNISTVLTVLDPRTDSHLVAQLFESLSLKLEIRDLPSFYERLTGKIPITNIGHIWFLENLAESEKSVYQVAKRILDIVISLIVLIISLPFVPLIMLFVKMDSRGPALFTQMRIGELGRAFRAVKFRSMIVGAEKEGEAQWAQKNDPRVTRFGRFMRRTRIDEIPQLLNVLKGEMSLVGPRPERPEFVHELQNIIPFYNERHLIKPGLTGWAQINFQYGDSAKAALKKLQYDLFYIKNRSLPLDLGIILKTINIMLGARGR